MFRFHFKQIFLNKEGDVLFFTSSNFSKASSWVDESWVAKIWLNYFVNDCHFGYIKKLLKETVLLALWPANFENIYGMNITII
jgi:hypothetical protein